MLREGDAMDLELGVADGDRNEFHVIYCVLFPPEKLHKGI